MELGLVRQEQQGEAYQSMEQGVVRMPCKIWMNVKAKYLNTFQKIMTVSINIDFSEKHPPK
jgi:hypothetical protein